MKALILVAGLGTRLRPITNELPKALVLIDGQPLLEYHLQAMNKYGIKEVLINNHYLPEKINKYVADYNNKNLYPKITITYEKELLGSAGTLKANVGYFSGEDNFLVIYGDNLTNINYQKLISKHLEMGGICTIACYHEEYIEAKGMVVFDKNNTINNFIEKPTPEQIVTNYANAGIYVCNRKIFDYLNMFDKIPLDFGHDIFPQVLIKKKDLLKCYFMDEFLLDVGTIDNYELAQEKIKNLKF